VALIGALLSPSTPLTRPRARTAVGRRTHRSHAALRVTVRDVGTWIDHLVFAAPTLEAGRSAIAALTGVTPAFGGVHTGAGTHNALASLGAPTYLEVIARDPDQPDAPPSP